MGFWSKVLGDGSFEGTNRLFDTGQQSTVAEYEPPVEPYQSTPQCKRRSDLDSMDSVPVESQGIINGPGRIWTRRHALNSRAYNGVPTGELGTYGLATGERVGVGGKMVDGSLGECPITDNGIPNTGYHIWHSFKPDSEVDARTVEMVLKREIKSAGYPFVPDAALATFFDGAGNFVGNDRNMKFKIRGHRDYITKSQEEEMGWS